ncbi:MAG TPA: hypothetical protein VER38_01480 [Candidatus Eisenbacteria bacterium]|nr:hypothetical protein [Candidatus Eisenbacteria bacterium]
MRLRPILVILLATLSASSLAGCSRKAEKLVGAARVIRGPGGLGTTVRLAPNPDRDTYVEPGTVDFDSLLLVGTSPPFQASTFLAVQAWTLPDTTLPGFAPQTISLELQRNLTLGFSPTQVTLSLTATAWDTTNVAWPGPAAAAQLGSATDDRLAAIFSLPLGPGSFAQVVQWAQNPSSVPGFTLQSSGPVAAYVAGAARFRVRYTHTVSGSPVLDSVDTRVTQDFYLHAPLTPTPTGADTALVLGSLYKTELAVHFPVDSIPSGVSVDEATLVLKLLPGSAVPDTADIGGVVHVRPIRNVWAETIAEKASLTFDAAPAASAKVISIYSSSARTLAIRLPGSLMREWASMPSTNDGLLVTLINRANLTRQLDIGSRESSRPPELHVTYTRLPPARF